MASGRSFAVRPPQALHQVTEALSHAWFNICQGTSTVELQVPPTTTIPFPVESLFNFLWLWDCFCDMYVTCCPFQLSMKNWTLWIDETLSRKLYIQKSKDLGFPFAGPREWQRMRGGGQHWAGGVGWWWDFSWMSVVSLLWALPRLKVESPWMLISSAQCGGSTVLSCRDNSYKKTKAGTG